LKEYIRYLDVNREPIIAHVISMDNEKEIPVEVA
jgi:DNA gyrase subunit B